MPSMTNFHKHLAPAALNKGLKMILVLLLSLSSSITIALGADKFGAAFVPKMTGGDETETQLFEIVGQMPEVDRVYAINSTIHMLQTLINLKKVGRPLNYLVIAGHGSKETPGIKWGADGMEGELIPEEIDLAYNKQQLQILGNSLQNPKLSNLKPAVLQKKYQECKQLVDLLEQTHGVMAPDGIVLLINCSAAATPRGRKYVKDFGELLLGVNGGHIIASRKDVKIKLQSSLIQRAWVQVLHGEAWEHPEYLVNADWEAFPIPGANKRTFTGAWGWRVKGSEGPFNSIGLTQEGNSVMMLDNLGGFERRHKGIIEGNVIKGRWDETMGTEHIEGPFELTIDDDDHMHGWSTSDKRNGKPIKGTKSQWVLERKKHH